MSERRGKERQRVFKSAKIAINRGGVIDCTVPGYIQGRCFPKGCEFHSAFPKNSSSFSMAKFNSVVA